MSEERNIHLAADFLSVGFELQLSSPTYDQLNGALAAKLAELIDNDFDSLLQLLYRIDVDEQKAKEALADNPLDEGPKVLAALIIDRQLEKIKTRDEHKSEGKRKDSE